MMLITHVSFALLLALGLIKYLKLPVNIYLFVVILVLAGILPDIDCPHTVLGKKFKFLSKFFKHRGFFHSIILAVILAIIVFLITLNRYYAFAAIIGFLSHIILDSLTPGGTIPFWPQKIRLKGKIKTGSVIDWILLIIFISLIVVVII